MSKTMGYVSLGGREGFGIHLNNWTKIASECGYTLYRNLAAKNQYAILKDGEDFPMRGIPRQLAITRYRMRVAQAKENGEVKS